MAMDIGYFFINTLDVVAQWAERVPNSSSRFDPRKGQTLVEEGQTRALWANEGLTLLE